MYRFIRVVNCSNGIIGGAGIHFITFRGALFAFMIIFREIFLSLHVAIFI